MNLSVLPTFSRFSTPQDDNNIISYTSKCLPRYITYSYVTVSLNGRNLSSTRFWSNKKYITTRKFGQKIVYNIHTTLVEEKETSTKAKKNLPPAFLNNYVRASETCNAFSSSSIISGYGMAGQYMFNTERSSVLRPSGSTKSVFPTS